MDEFFPISFLRNTDKRVLEEIKNCNATTKEYGLILSPDDISTLVTAKNNALASSGRIEPGGSIVHKIILSFCDSPFISQQNYVETISELVDIFYFYKNETLDLISDDELIKWMKIYFNGRCQGSLDLLKGRELNRLADNVIHGNIDFQAYDDTLGQPEEYDDE